VFHFTLFLLYSDVLLLTGELKDKVVTQVACGDSHTVCVTTEGAVFSWGLGTDGKLGLGNADRRLVPCAVDLGSVRCIQVAAGAAHTAAVTRDGSVYSWGSSKHGQLGLGDTSAKSIPTFVRAMEMQVVVQKLTL